MASQAEVDLVISTADTLPDLERDLNRIVRQAENGAPDIDVNVGIDTSQSLAQLDAQIGSVIDRVQGRTDDVEVGVLVQQQEAIRTLRRQIDQVVDSVSTGNAVDPVTVRAVLDGDRAFRNISGELERATRRIQNSIDPIEVETTVDNDSLRRTTQQLTRFARSAGEAGFSMLRLGTSVAGAGAALGAVLPLVAGVAAAAQQVAPAAAVAVSGMLAMQLAAGTLKLAMVGVEDAISAAFDPDTKPEELEKALKKLAPEARKFVVELRSMRGALRQVQQEVQNRVFQDLDQVLRDLSGSVLPVVRTALNNVATSLNTMARSAATAAGELAEDGTLGEALDGAAKGLENLSGLPGQIVKGLGQIGAAAAPAFDKLTRRIDTAATQIAEDLTRAFETGALEDEINAAIDTIGQLGRIGGNILSGIGNIFSGLTTNGRGLFDILEDITQAFEELTASEEFQTILSELALTADELVKGVLPLLKEAFIELAPVVEELAPVVREFVKEIGPELIPVIRELGPLLVDIARIFKEQLPTAITLTKSLLGILTQVLSGLHKVLDGFVIPAVRAVSGVFENRYIKTLAEANRLTSSTLITMITDFGEFKDRVVQSLSIAIGNLVSFGLAVKDRFVSVVGGGLLSIGERFRELPGQIRSALSSAAVEMFGVGANIVRGLINGLLSQIGSLLSTARSIADSVSGTIKDALNIQSPSRVMIDVGEDTGAGLEIGLRKTIPSIQAASLDMAGAITPSFLTPDGQSLQLNPAPQGAPLVQVYIGNEQLDARTDARINASNKTRNRVLSQGVRR